MSIATELIARGWTQGEYEADDGSVCLRGACAYARGAESAHADATHDQATALAHAMHRRVDDFHLYGAIAAFNDTPDRTFDEVLRVAKQADELLGL